MREGTAGRTAYTVADMAHLIADSDAMHELHGGELIEMPPASDESTEVGVTIAALLWAYVIPNQLGRVMGADSGFVLAPDVLYSPDTAFVSRERAQPRTRGFYPYAPDFAVEVVSPTDRAARIQEKVTNYLRYGTRLVWVVYPDTRAVVVHTGEGAKTYGHDATLDGGEVLPGFSVTVRQIFAVLED